MIHSGLVDDDPLEVVEVEGGRLIDVDDTVVDVLVEDIEHLGAGHPLLRSGRSGDGSGPAVASASSSIGRRLREVGERSGDIGDDGTAERCPRRLPWILGDLDDLGARLQVVRRFPAVVSEGGGAHDEDDVMAGQSVAHRLDARNQDAFEVRVRGGERAPRRRGRDIDGSTEALGQHHRVLIDRRIVDGGGIDLWPEDEGGVLRPVEDVGELAPQRLRHGPGRRHRTFRQQLVVGKCWLVPVVEGDGHVDGPARFGGCLECGLRQGARHVGGRQRLV